MTLRRLFVAALATTLALPDAKAQLLYSNGAATGAGYGSFVNSGTPGIKDQLIFDNFLVAAGGWRVTSLVGAVFNTFDNPLGTLYWQIRTGMRFQTVTDPGSVGSVLFSGSASSYASLGRVRTIEGLLLDLDAGEYWMTMYNDAGGDFTRRGGYVQATNGIDAVAAIGDGKAIWLVNNGVDVRTQPTDFAFGAIGVAPIPVPEPGAASLIALGFAWGWLILRRQQRRS